jgi:hypothetical protein
LAVIVSLELNLVIVLVDFDGVGRPTDKNLYPASAEDVTKNDVVNFLALLLGAVMKADDAVVATAPLLNRRAIAKQARIVVVVDFE